ncbi:MAG: DUF6470 family protein [Symbiobacteriaceae bacterium]|nr:DUF6470 family protein [Symbiobacteriaceae bacterium]
MVQIPRYNLEINITFAQIGIQTQNAQLEMQMEPSAAWRQFNPPQWQVIPKDAYIEINYDAWRAEFDIETPVRWTEKIVAEGRVELEEENRWRARNGDLCYRATPGDKRPVIDFAMHFFHLQEANAWSNVGLSPVAQPDITAVVDPAQRFQWEPFAAAAFSFRITATPPSVEVYLEVQPEVRIRAIPLLDARV